MTVLVLVFLAFYGLAVYYTGGKSPWALLLFIPLAALGAGMICVLISRIREIRSGEEDDLDNY